MEEEQSVENEILKYIIKNPGIQRQKLKDYFETKHSKGKLGYSSRSIDRKLAKLQKQNKIRSVKMATIKKELNLPDSNNHYSYLYPIKDLKIKEHFNIILQLIKSEVEKLFVIQELKKYYDTYYLSPYELDELIKILISNENGEYFILDLDDKSIDILLELFENSIIRENKKPNNGYVFVYMLQKLLAKYPSKNETYPKLRTNIIQLLGYYNDKTVIEQIKKDAENLDDPQSVERDYYFNSEFSVIIEHIEELFKFELELRKRGDEKSKKGADFISRIKFYNK